MKIAIDTSVYDVTGAGGATYTRELVRALRRLDAAPDIVELRHRARLDRSKSVLRKLDGLYRETYWRHSRLPAAAREAGVDLLHGPALTLPLRSRLPCVVTIYDAYLNRYPEALPRVSGAIDRAMRRAVLRRADRIITISDFTRRELMAVYPWLPPTRIAVTPLGVSDHFTRVLPDAGSPVLARHGVQSPYVLSLCTIEPRKNLLRLIDAFAEVSRDCPHTLVMVGAPGRGISDVRSRVASHGLESRVRFLGRVDEEDLPALYSGAAAFAYVPVYEGFGLPPLEAMACGTPVLTSLGTSLDEVVGHAALQVDSARTDAIASGLRTLLLHTEEADRLRVLGRARAAQFTWERCAEQTVAVYRDVLRERSSRTPR